MGGTLACLTFVTVKMMSESHPEPNLHEAAILAWVHEFAPYGVITTDADFRIQTWNRFMEVHSGLGPEAVLGKDLFQLFPEIGKRRLRGYFDRALTGEVSVLSTALHGYLVPLSLSVRDGAFSQMQQTARVAPLLFEKKVVGTIVVIEDVTQRELQSLILRRKHEHDELLSWALAHLLKSQEAR